RLLGDQRPFLAEAISRTGKCECHNQSKQREHGGLDRAQIAALTLRFFRLAPDAKATTNFQQRQHACEEQYSEQKCRDRGFHRCCRSQPEAKSSEVYPKAEPLSWRNIPIARAP